ncbi:MAG: LamG domain-containing protein [Cytophagaceae bacterium]|nr:MAG: LamG domain-containing protein [Cytophagaceae bacterium]
MKRAYSLLALLSLFSCAKKVVDPTPTPTVPPINSATSSVRGYSATTPASTIQLKPAAILVRKDLNDKLVELGASHITYLASAESNTISVGEVLYSQPTDKAPDGYALVVVKKTVQGSNVVFETRPATFSDVFVKLKEDQTYVPDFTKDPPIFYDPLDPANQNGRKITGGNPLDPKRFKNIELTEKSINVDYVLFDGDGNLSTENDQFLLGLKLDHTLTNMTIDFDGDLKLSGEHKYSFTPSLSYTYNADKVSKDFVKSTVDNFKRNLIGKKILICSVPLPANPAFVKVSKPTFDLYLTFALEGTGKFKVYYSYENFGYTFTYNSAKKTENSFTALPTAQHTFGAEIEFEGKAKLAIGAGIFLKFPAFEYEENNPSYIGLTSEVGVGAEFNFTGGLYSSGGLSCKKLTIKPTLTWDSYLEAKLGVLEKPSIDQKYTIYSKTPQRLADRTWDVCEKTDVLAPFDIKTGLIAYYSFNGHSKDSTANALHAVPLNGAVLTADRNGRANRAYALSSAQKSTLKISTSRSTTVVTFADTTNALNQLRDKMTLSAWVYLNRGATIFPILTKRGYKGNQPIDGGVTEDNHFNFTLESSYFAGAGKDFMKPIFSGNATCYCEAKVPLENKNLDLYFPQETWVHVVTVQDGSTTRLYFNGTLVQETTTTNCFKYPKTGHFSPLYIGSTAYGWTNNSDVFGTYHSDGKIDEVYIFKRALTAADIKGLYASPN